MVKIIMGLKGTGKTKNLIEMVNKTVKKDHGSVVCIEKDNKLLYDINHEARLICAADYKINTYDSFYGFICGIVAGNFDITDIFIDSITKICDNNENMDDLSKFIEAIDHISKETNIYITVSYDTEKAPESIKKYF